MNHIPEQPKNSFRVILQLNNGKRRLDIVLLEALRAQNENPTFKIISRKAFKQLFSKKRVFIKGQLAKPSSSIEGGTTYVDIK
jgi:hypothetical protein